MVPFNPFFFRVGSVEINREAAQGGWRVPLIAGGPASVDNPGLQWEPGMPLPQKSDPALARYGELRVLLGTAKRALFRFFSAHDSSARSRVARWWRHSCGFAPLPSQRRARASATAARRADGD
jgi:hypothetical protein